MNSLWEAIALVVLVSLIGFWEWRSAALMAVSIPITLAMTFGMMQILGVDLQQVSIASLIIALGLLVDDPVVAGDAIKRGLAGGHPRGVAAWLGPTKLAHAILYATITNIVAYMPFLLLTGDTGRFVYTLPVVITCSLVASRLVSMTFIPMLGYYLLRGKAEPVRGARAASRRSTTASAAGRSTTVGRFWRAPRRYWRLACSAASGSSRSSSRRTGSTWHTSTCGFRRTRPWPPRSEAARRAEKLILRYRGGRHAGIRHVVDRRRRAPVLVFGIAGTAAAQLRGDPDQDSRQAPNQPSAARVAARPFGQHPQRPHRCAAARDRAAGRRAGVHPDIGRRYSGAARAGRRRLKQILREAPASARVRDDWGEETLAVNLAVDPDRANLAGISNYDVATASVAAFNGISVATLRDGDKNIPIVARLRMEQRSQVADFDSLYVSSQPE